MDVTAILYALLVLGALGLVFGIVLGIADKKFFVPADERVERIRACLPGANCGACGFAGCDAYADAVASGKVLPNCCPVGGSAAACAIGDVIGCAVEVSEPVRARVLCQGTTSEAVQKYEYDGYKSCRAAIGIAGGPKQCRFSCVGLGDCAAACPFDAITMRDGIANIDEGLCVGCGVCVDICPRNVIKLLPIMKNQVIVCCRNTDSGREARAVCKKACIACGRCEKACKFDAIKVIDGCAVIDQQKCTRCNECVAVCPTKCITVGS